MAADSGKSHSYKDLTFQQLRSFCETVRLGGFAAAARALDLARPTVWQQVHALERRYGVKLVEPYARGCKLTEAGQLLAGFASQIVTGVESLDHAFQAALAKTTRRLVVATTPRILVEDLPDCVRAFERRWPEVQLTLMELRIEEVGPAVESGRADIGLGVVRDPDIPYTTAGPADGLHRSTPWLMYEPVYQLERILIMPPGHPLAQRRTIRLRDLRNYPLVNAPSSFSDEIVRLSLERTGAFVGPRRVEVFYGAAIKRYVEMGYGLGLTLRVPSHPSDPRFHERSLRRDFDLITVYAVWRRGALQSPEQRDFVDQVKTVLGQPPSASRAASGSKRSAAPQSRGDAASRRRRRVPEPDGDSAGRQGEHGRQKKRLER
jgi:DNA-binding transcriptional LysR family regulator